jgi:hypothetical protein
VSPSNCFFLSLIILMTSLLARRLS